MKRFACTALVLIVMIAAGCASGPKQGSRAPEYDAVDADGGAFSSASLHGKIVVYYFWATWCAPCVTSGPEIQDVHERYAGNDDVRVVGVHYDNRGDARAYVEQHGYTWELIPDGRSLVAAFGVKKIPQVVVVGSGGEVAFSQIGFAKGDGQSVVEVIERQVGAGR